MLDARGAHIRCGAVRRRVEPAYGVAGEGKHSLPTIAEAVSAAPVGVLAMVAGVVPADP